MNDFSNPLNPLSPINPASPLNPINQISYENYGDRQEPSSLSGKETLGMVSGMLFLTILILWFIERE